MAESADRKTLSPLITVVSRIYDICIRSRECHPLSLCTFGGSDRAIVPPVPFAFSKISKNTSNVCPRCTHMQMMMTSEDHEDAPRPGSSSSGQRIRPVDVLLRHEFARSPLNQSATRAAKSQESFCLCLGSPGSRSFFSRSGRSVRRVYTAMYRLVSFDFRV